MKYIAIAIAAIALPHVTVLPQDGRKLLVCLGPGGHFHLPPSAKDTFVVKLCADDAGDGATVEAPDGERLDNDRTVHLTNPWQSRTFLPVNGGYYID